MSMSEENSIQVQENTALITITQLPQIVETCVCSVTAGSGQQQRQKALSAQKNPSRA